MEIIQNETLEIAVQTAGAELCRIRSLATGQEYMWDGNPQIWGSFAPVLFPIVGTLKDNTYLYDGKSYQLPRHGFFRKNDKVKLIQKSNDLLIFSLKSDPDSLRVYPFEFEMQIAFILKENSLYISHTVRNTGEKNLLFSLGGHPAFKCPLKEGEKYEDYHLHFEHTEYAPTWDLDGGGIISGQGRLVLDNQNRLPLHSHLFDQDALIFKNLQSSSVSLNHNLSGPVLRVNFKGWPYLGIWAKPQAPYVCIEPWLGIADSTDTDQRLETKEGIVTLLPGREFEATFSIDILNLKE
ncbi:MAG: aldose 1-epimerase family protein [Bacteroidia bacterium]|nr:aldose 1-epimerase family protein [Bacteroidia bacterium]